ncbi:MAG: hypothetical protein E6R03_12780 [Hyphomicrobiaceae bacterium]|nr:MAG: hypothetical protein E6R03_12780 [Hyphomicrobiaceae bacterium]
MGTARHFDGTNDYVRDQSFTVIDSGSWSMGLWYWQDDAPGANETLVELLNSGSGGVVQWLYTLANGNIQCRQLYATTSALVNATAPATGVWNCAVGTYDSGSKTCSLFLGDVDSPMAEPSYSTDTSGVGTRSTGGNYAGIGCNPNSATGRPFDGKIAVAFCVPWEMDQSDAEKFRSGDLRILWRNGVPRFVVLFSENGAYDLANPTNAWTISGAVDAEGPPVRFRMRSRSPSQFLSADVSSTAHVLGLVSAGGMIDSLSRVMASVLTAVNSEGGLDYLAKVSESAKAITDAMAGADTWTRVLELQRTASDTTGETDSMTTVSSISRSVSELEGATDSVIRVTDGSVTAADEVSATDLFAAVTQFSRDLNDGDGLLDHLVVQTVVFTDFVIGISDSFALDDQFGSVSQFSIEQLDDLSASDLVAALQSVSRGATDLSGVEDYLTFSATFGVALADAEGLDDTLVRVTASNMTFDEAIEILNYVIEQASRRGQDVTFKAALVDHPIVRAAIVRLLGTRLLEEQ